MRLPLVPLEVFNAIAREGSLRAAAARLGLQPSTVSHQLKSLEQQIGTPLFVRTTRKVTLTDAGRELYRGTGPAYEQLGNAVDSAREVSNVVRGNLRITLPEFAYEMIIAHRLADFCQRYPEISLEFNVTEAFVDIVEREFHAGIRLGDRIDPDMISVRLLPQLGLSVFASHAYLDSHGTPQTPFDLPKHNCIRYRYQQSGRFAPWTFSGPDGDYDVAVTGNLVVNTLPSLASQVRQGLGLGYTFSDYALVREGDGEITHLFRDQTPILSGVFLYFPREYRANKILRLFIDSFSWKG